MKSFKEFIADMLSIGTPECGLFCAVIGLILAILLLTVGFWKMVMVVLFCVAGAFIGGVKDKIGWLKAFLNKVIPEPDKHNEE